MSLKPVEFSPHPDDAMLWNGRYLDGFLTIRQDKDNILYYVFTNTDFQCFNGIIIPEGLYSDSNWEDIFELVREAIARHYEEASILSYNQRVELQDERLEYRH